MTSQKSCLIALPFFVLANIFATAATAGSVKAPQPDAGELQRYFHSAEFNEICSLDVYCEDMSQPVPVRQAVLQRQGYEGASYQMAKVNSTATDGLDVYNEDYGSTKPSQ